MKAEFATAGRIVFGAGSLREAGSLTKEYGRRALVVTGRDGNRARGLFETLEANGIACIPFSVSGEPEIGTVETGTELARRERCDVVVSCGGGSAIDGGKAIAAMLANDGSLLEYLEVIGRGRTLAKPGAPFIAIPTTAGTGSEVTRNAVLAAPEHKVKVSLRSPLMLPRVALVDPELTYGLPPAETASTGLDALTQLTEPYVSSRANPLTDPLCENGIRRAARSLRAAFRDGQNKSAREDMSVASLFGGLALANAGLGAVHGFAGPLGGMFPAPHGALCAALLPHAIAVNLRALRQRQPGGEALRRFDQIARWVTGNPEAVAEDTVEWISKLNSDLQIPRLSSYGVMPQHVGGVVEKAAKASSMKANPVALTREELEQILRESL